MIEVLNDFLHLIYKEIFKGDHIIWNNFPDIGLSEFYYSYYYAGKHLYVIRDAMTDALYFICANSHKEAFLKLNLRLNAAIEAGGWQDV